MLLRIKKMVWKDLILEVRSFSELGAAIVFAVSSSSIIGFVANRYLAEVRGMLLIGAGLILVEIFLAVFTASMGFVREADKETLDGLRSSPVEPIAIFTAKLIFTLIILEALSMIAGLAAIFFGGNAAREASLLLPLLLATGIYLSSVSAFASAISIYVEARGILLPTLILVLSIPLIQNLATLLENPLNPWGILLLTASGLGFTLIASWLSRYILEV